MRQAETSRGRTSIAQPQPQANKKTGNFDSEFNSTVYRWATEFMLDCSAPATL